MPADPPGNELGQYLRGLETDHEFLKDRADFFDELTDDLVDALLRAAATGVLDRYVALSCCMLPERLQELLVMGCEPGAKGLLRRFAVQYHRIVADLAKNAVEGIQRGAEGWQGRRQFLENRFPAEYGKDAKPGADPIAGGAARLSKKEQARAALRRRDPAFLKMALEEGLLEALQELKGG